MSKRKLVCPDCERELDAIEEERTYDKFERLGYEWRNGRYGEVHFYESDPADPQSRFFCPHCGCELPADEVEPRLA